MVNDWVRGSLRVGTPPEDGDLVVRSLAEAAWGIYCSAEYAEAHGMPIDPQQLSNHPLLGFEGFLADAPAGQWIREHGAKSSPAGQSNNLVNHLQAVKAGIGVVPCRELKETVIWTCGSASPI